MTEAAKDRYDRIEAQFEKERESGERGSEFRSFY
jgi:hypothetical protein